MKKAVILIVILLISNIANAQFIKEKSITAQIGYAITVPDNGEDNVINSGFYAQGELMLKVTSWFSIRPYAGLILTNSNEKDVNDQPTDERGETKAFLLGGKGRVRAPIPWVAPYVEVGIGTSIGKFETVTAFDAIDKSGIIYHIPFSLGLELGKNHNVDVGFVYYFQPSVEQYVGALAVGITFPL